MDRFRTAFNINDNVHPVRRQIVLTEEATATVQESIEKNPN